MTKKIIVLAGGTGNLGQQIVKTLLQLNAEVRLIVRPTSNLKTIEYLANLGAKIFTINMQSQSQIAQVCQGASCFVSAVAGLQNVIIDAQTLFVKAAIEANVPRFIPSDYCLDFTPFAHGTNRNLDTRRIFATYLNAAPIKATSIFNGAFANMLTNQIPMIIFKKKWVLYWGNKNHKMPFTTIANTAAYTAYASLDDTAPRYLRIAGSAISASEIRSTLNQLTGQHYKLIKTGSQTMLGVIIKTARLLSPGTTQLYPAWQGMQYMHNMVDPKCLVNNLHNNRYSNITFTTVAQLLDNYIKTQP